MALLDLIITEHHSVATTYWQLEVYFMTVNVHNSVAELFFF